MISSLSFFLERNSGRDTQDKWKGATSESLAFYFSACHQKCFYTFWYNMFYGVFMNESRALVLTNRKPTLRERGGPLEVAFFKVLGYRWAAGPLAEDSIDAAKRLQAKDAGAVLNRLGEHYTTQEKVEEAVRGYLRIIELIGQRDLLDVGISLKPTQFGLHARDVTEPVQYCYDNMERVALAAARTPVIKHIGFDAEDHTTIDFTLEAYISIRSGVRQERRSIGLDPKEFVFYQALQANLLRTEADLRRLIRLGAAVRLVKGIYKEPKEVAFTREADKHGNFSRLIRIAFEESDPDFAIFIGSHHTERIREAVEFQKRHPKNVFGVQLLYGVAQQLIDELVAQGIRVQDYTPGGPESFAYGVRRMRENPGFAMTIIRWLFFEAAYRLRFEPNQEERHGPTEKGNNASA